MNTVPIETATPPAPAEAQEGDKQEARHERERAEEALACLTRAAGSMQIALVPLAPAVMRGVDGGEGEGRQSAYVVDPATKKKAIMHDDGLPLFARVWSIAHALGHAALGHRYQTITLAEAEKEANAFADQFCSRFILPTARQIPIVGRLPMIRKPRRPLVAAVGRTIRLGAPSGGGVPAAPGSVAINGARPS